MWISKKKWRALEGRVADLEIKSQQHKATPLDQMKEALKEALQFDAHQVQTSQSPLIILKPFGPIASLIKKGN